MLGTKSFKRDDASSLAAYTQADIIPTQTQPLQNIQDLSDIERIEIQGEFTHEEEKIVVNEFARTEKINIQVLDESSQDQQEQTLK